MHKVNFVTAHMYAKPIKESRHPKINYILMGVDRPTSFYSIQCLHTAHAAACHVGEVYFI